MINQFHKTSQLELMGHNLPNPRTRGGVQCMTDLMDDFIVSLNMTEEQRRTECIREIQEKRQSTREDPKNLWRVYELCKQVYELAELDRVDFNGASYIEKLNLISQIVPFADPEALAEGVVEYHESRIRENWKMRFLEVRDDRQSIQRTAGTDC
jgi:hypothetical protein